MFDLLRCAFCSTYSVWPTGSVTDSTTRSNEHEIAIKPTTPSPIFFDQPDDAYAETTICFDPETTWGKYKPENKFEKLKTQLEILKISEKTIDTLAEYIKNKSDEEHKKVLLNNIEWYACACDSISDSLSENISAHHIRDVSQNLSWLSGLTQFNEYFDRYITPLAQLHKGGFANRAFFKETQINEPKSKKLWGILNKKGALNDQGELTQDFTISKKTLDEWLDGEDDRCRQDVLYILQKVQKFQHNLNNFKNFYHRAVDPQNGVLNDNRFFSKHEIIASLMHEDIDAEILNWDATDCLKIQFNNRLDLLQCTDYKKIGISFCNKITTDNDKIHYCYINQMKALGFN